VRADTPGQPLIGEVELAGSKPSNTAKGSSLELIGTGNARSLNTRLGPCKLKLYEGSPAWVRSRIDA